MFTYDTAQRVNALAKAMHWFDKVLSYLVYKQEGKLTTNQLRALNRGFKLRSKGIASSSDEEKKELFKKAIQNYEVAVEKYKPPLLKKVVVELNKKAKTFKQRHEKYSDKHGKFIQIIHAALKPLGKFHVDRLNAPYHLHSNGDITFNRKYVEELRRLARKKGIFSSVLELLPVMVRQVGHEAEFKRMFECLVNFNKYCQSPEGPRTVIRRKKETKDE